MKAQITQITLTLLFTVTRIIFTEKKRYKFTNTRNNIAIARYKFTNTRNNITETRNNFTETYNDLIINRRVGEYIGAPS